LKKIAFAAPATASGEASSKTMFGDLPPSSSVTLIRPRSDGVMRSHGPSSNAFRAAATARLTSSASPSAMWASVAPVAGLGVSNVLPEAASAYWPLMKS